ncbi:hypothetical protein CF394_13990 [Tetzosporium hominis]|uniref:Polysaccharide biosynthesis protein C-terminal domain-containing protein n=1 Tax=Tetzosporium hominis TaxID=2020506 RepID=A0A264W1P0_9BACL|nr:oligosaccharide flippase family protein [Tetzosporium hominis]OZS76957.1 hypothetical protein CF394_13990 [Tetzosporium hominis]
MKVSISKRTITQFSMLMLSNYAVVIISFMVNILMTHAMNEDNFGYYKYAISIIIMSSALINGGIHFSAARLIAINDVKKEKSLLSTTVIITVAISVVYAILALIILIILNKYLINVDDVVFFAIPLVFTIILQRMYITVLKGSNRISDIVFQTVLPQVILLVIYFVLKKLDYKIEFELALIIYGTVYFIIHLITWLRLGLTISSSFKNDVSELLNENKSNGFQLYKGSLAGVFVGDLLTVIVGGMINKSIFGMYSLALSMSAPLSMIPLALATIKFKENANNGRLSKKNIVGTILISLLGFVILNIGVKTFFPIFFDPDYNEALNFMIICSITFLIHGIGDYFNQFSSSQGLGNKLKIGAYISGIAQLTCAIILVPSYGIWGLIYSKLISSSIYSFSMIYIYFHFIKLDITNKKGEES